MVIIIFYDFEIFKYNWLVVLIDVQKQKIWRIHDDPEQLRQVYEEYKLDVWVGFNSNHYDQFILKAILLGIDPKKVNDYIIIQNRAGYSYDSEFYKIKYIGYDCINAVKDGRSLKQLEGFMGNSIHETSVPFDIDRPLTDAEIEETFSYCEDDVKNTIEVFYNSIDDFKAVLSLIRTFNLPLTYVSKTKAQLSAIILNCQKTDFPSHFDITIVPTLRIGKYTDVLRFYENYFDYNSSLETEIAGVTHKFGIGGVHGARSNYHHKGLLIHVDVTSYYPSMMLKYGFLTRASQTPEKYREIYDTRVALKKAGKKAEQAPYKIVLNGTYGIAKDETSTAYDPLQANNICINGQLLLVDLIDKLESIDGFELIQSNTDGLIIKIPDTDKHFNMLDDICYEWEQRTGMGLGFDYVTEIWQKDVNNYVFRFDNGKLERKGGYVLELNELDNDLPIVNKAIVDYLTAGIPIETTINSCNDLKQFQMICKISSKYKALFHGDLQLTEKCVRVFASKDNSDKGLKKLHNKKNKPDKFPNSPANCFIDNGNVNGKPVPDKLDREFYISMAKERASGFGI